MKKVKAFVLMLARLFCANKSHDAEMSASLEHGTSMGIFETIFSSFFFIYHVTRRMEHTDSNDITKLQSPVDPKD